MRYLFGDYALDTSRRELRRGGELLSIEPKAFDLLAYVIGNRERVVSRGDLIATVWDGRIVSESTLASCINAARSAIGDSGEAQRLIKTLPRKGIRFVGAVREEKTRGGTASLADGKPEGDPALPDKPSVAVLPFTNMSGDPEQEYFADGMADEIITALSRCSSLFVIARNSSFTYKSKTVDVRRIGRELGVRYVLEGSVRRAANRLRIVGQLVDATSGAHIWADRFEGDLSDVFELQDRITESVVGAIEPKLQLAEIERIKRKPAADLNAYDLFLRAQQLHNEFTEESFAAAIGCLHQALAIDPAYAPAMALAAYCYAERRMQGWAHDPDTEAVVGHRLAERAIDLAPDDAGVLWMSAHAVRVLGRNLHRAGELLSLSLQLNAHSAMALTIAALNETRLAKPHCALELLNRAERISPRDPRAWVMTTARADGHYVAEEFDQAVFCARRALARNPRSTRAMRILAASLAKAGKVGEAAEVIRDVVAIEPGLTISKMRARLNFWPEGVWRHLEEGLRLAGLPE